MNKKLTLAILILLSPLAICAQQTKAAPTPIATVKVAFCPSWGTSTDPSLIYATLANNWSLYGDYSLEFINVGAPVTYGKLVATEADVVIVCNPSGGTRQYLQSEADAIQEFLSNGSKGIFMTYALNWSTYDNSFLAPLVGVKSSALDNNSRSHNKNYDLYKPKHPIFANVSDPYNSGGYVQSQNLTVPSWSDAIFPSTEIVAETTDSNAAVIAYDDLWRGVWVTSMVDYGGNEEDKQFVYNSILWLAHLTDAAPPTILIESPQNTTYTTTSVPLNFTVNKPTSWIGYSLDGQTNETTTGNTTIAIPDGPHTIVVYANDTFGNTGSSNTVYFTVDTTAPNITSVTQMPLPDDVLLDDEVQVNATILDNTSGVKQATLIYAYANDSGSWIKSIDMTNVEGNIWSATIPAFPNCTRVTYTVMAEDNAGNTVSSEELGYEYQYQVIPEFPTWTSILLILILLTVSIAITKRKTFKTQIR